MVEDDIAPHKVVFKLSGILLSTLKNAEGRKYLEPWDAFRRLVGDQSTDAVATTHVMTPVMSTTYASSRERETQKICVSRRLNV